MIIVLVEGSVTQFVHVQQVHQVIVPKKANGDHGEPVVVVIKLDFAV